MKLRDLWPWAGRKETVWERWVRLLDNGGRTLSGTSVNLKTAFRVSASLACLREISQGGAQVPLKLFMEYEEGSLRRKRPAREHHLYDLITAKPNSWQTAFEFRETLLLHAALGNAYVFKNLYRGKIAELILLQPHRVKAEQKEDWSVQYTIRGANGELKQIPSDLIWHVRGPSWDGFLGIDILDAAKEALGLSVALEESQAGLHANGVRPSGTFSVDGKLSTEQHKDLTAWIKQHAGASNTGAPLILDRGAKWLQQSMTSVDAQAKEMRDQQIEEVCRFFGVLPIVIGHSGDKSSTYASAEAMFAAQREKCLARWWQRIQESADVNLLSDEERRAGHYFKHVPNGLMLASSKDQGDYFAKALGAGGSPAWLTQDEVRSYIELDPMGGAAAQLPERLAAPGPTAPAN